MCFTPYNLNDLVVGQQELNLRTANVIHSFIDGDRHFIVAGNGTPFPAGAGGPSDEARAFVLTQVGSTGVEEIDLSDQCPRVLVLDAAPSPFTVETTLSFELPSAASALVSVYDVLGRRIATLTEGNHAAGRTSLSWAGTDDTGAPVPSGVYLVRLESERGVRITKVLRVAR